MRPSPAAWSYCKELSVASNKGTMFCMVYGTRCCQATTKQCLCTEKRFPSNLLKAFHENHFLEEARIRCFLAISKLGNGESMNGERGTGNGVSLKRGISKIRNL